MLRNSRIFVYIGKRVCSCNFGEAKKICQFVYQFVGFCLLHHNILPKFPKRAQVQCGKILKVPGASSAGTRKSCTKKIMYMPKLVYLDQNNFKTA